VNDPFGTPLGSSFARPLLRAIQGLRRPLLLSSGMTQRYAVVVHNPNIRAGRSRNLQRVTTAGGVPLRRCGLPVMPTASTLSTVRGWFCS